MDKEEKIQELKAKRSDLYHSLLLSSSSFKRAKKLISSLEERYLKDRRAWEECDYELALLDGRRQVVEPNVKRSRSTKDVDISTFTNKQLMEIAERLNLNLKLEIPE